MNLTFKSTHLKKVNKKIEEEKFKLTFLFYFEVWAAIQDYLENKNVILNWNLETDNIEGDELLGVNVLIMKRDKKSKKKIMTLTFRQENMRAE